MSPASNFSATPPSQASPADNPFEVSNATQGQRMRTKRILVNLLSYWYLIALCLIIGVAGSAYYLSKAPKKYSATSTMLIKEQTSAVMGKDQAEEIDMRSMEALNTVAERIRRPDIMERVASRMDVRALPGLMPAKVRWTPEWLAKLIGSDKDVAKEDAENKKQPPEAIALSGSISSWMTVSLRRGTRLMDITFQHEVPEVAKSLADAVTREYLAEIAGSKTEGRNNRSDTLIKQSEEARIKLQSVASALASYNRALESHKELDAQEALTAQLTHRYLPKHPKIIAALNELEALKKRFLREFDVAVASSADEAYWKTVRTQIDDAMAKPETHLQVARQLLLSRTGVLNGEANSQMSVFNAMLTRLEESRVNSEGEESNAEVSSLARISYTPVSPIPTKVYTSGAACGLTAGLFFAWLLIRMDNKYMSVAQVEAETGIPVLAAISDIDPRHVEKAINSAAKGRSVLPEPELQDGWAPRLVFRAGASTTNFAEMFRILRASITLLGDESTRKVTLFSSALPGEGKSLVSANFALAAAGQGRRTLLVDLDLRKPSIHHIFGFEHSREVPGISELLAGTTTFEKAIVRETGAENLHIIFSGGHATNPGELLNVSRVKQMLAEASKQYDVIVLDSAPLLAVPDTRVLADLADNFCLVVRSDYVPKGAVLRTLSLLSTAHTPVSGLIFNGYKERRRMLDENYSYGSYRLTRYGRPYQYGYGSYGTYGASDADDAKEIAARKKRKNRRKQK